MTVKISSGNNKILTASQVSGCTVVVHPYSDFDIIKELVVGAGSDFENKSDKVTGNLNTKNRVVIDNDVVRCNLTKNKASVSGTFSINLKQGRVERSGVALNKKINYLKVIHPGDWILIYMDKRSVIDVNSTTPSSGFKMLGIVENVRYIEVDSPDGGHPRLEYIITGKDFGKVFEMDFFINPVAAKINIQQVMGVEFSTGLLRQVNKRTNQIEDKQDIRKTPDYITLALVDYFLGGTFSKRNREHQEWYVPEEVARLFLSKSKSKTVGKSFIDILNLDRVGFHKYVNKLFVDAKNELLGETIVIALPSAGTLWQMLQFLQNALLNEMYTELTVKRVNNKDILVPTLVLRQYPFSTKGSNGNNNGDKTRGITRKEILKSSSKSYFKDLPQFTIKSDEIKSKNVGKSDFERVNHIVVVPRLEQAGFDIAYKSSFNVPSIQRYGLKSLKTQTQYIASKSMGFENYTEVCIELLQDWFFQSHAFYNGTLVIDGIEGFMEIGTNLFIEDISQLFHIEGYTHTYMLDAASAKPSYNTEIRVSRGQILKNNKLDFIDSQSNKKESITVVTSNLENIRNN